jgi:hypothetical protein
MAKCLKHGLPSGNTTPLCAVSSLTPFTSPCQPWTGKGDGERAVFSPPPSAPLDTPCKRLRPLVDAAYQRVPIVSVWTDAGFAMIFRVTWSPNDVSRTRQPLKAILIHSNNVSLLHFCVLY